VPRWPAYVPVSERRARGLQALRRLGREPSPVVIEGRGRAIATSYWGKAWCANLERYSDLATRLPRGRTYLRNGSVLDLGIEPGRVRAWVAGSELYTVEVRIQRLPPARWETVQADCRGKIGSLVGLLRGQLSDEVMQVLTQPRTGLFPEPREIAMDCSCPDGAYLCKHLAATLYAVGARLDHAPELFFVLRQVEQADLVSSAIDGALAAAPKASGKKKIAADQLGAVFGIDVEARRPARRR
jgi:uncharacterized Zn finger protein